MTALTAQPTNPSSDNTDSPEPTLPAPPSLIDHLTTTTARARAAAAAYIVGAAAVYLATSIYAGQVVNLTDPDNSPLYHAATYLWPIGMIIIAAAALIQPPDAPDPSHAPS